MLILVLVSYVLLIIYEFVPLYKEKKWADFLVNAVLCCTSLSLAILFSLDIKLPSPETPIRKMIMILIGK